jgi:hypothetical protein
LGFLLLPLVAETSKAIQAHPDGMTGTALALNAFLFEFPFYFILLSGKELYRQFSLSILSALKSSSPTALTFKSNHQHRP